MGNLMNCIAKMLIPKEQKVGTTHPK